MKKIFYVLCLSLIFAGCEEENKIAPKESKKTVIDENGNIQSETFYEYDSKGNVIKTENKSNGEILIYTFDYDEHNNLIKQYKDGILIFDYSYEYDENGKKTKKTTITHDESCPYLYESYVYDEKGNIKKTISSYNSDSVPDRFTEYEYDSKNNLIKSTYVSIYYDYDLESDKEEKLISEYKRNSKGDVYEITSNGKPITRIEIEYKDKKTIKHIKDIEKNKIKTVILEY